MVIITTLSSPKTRSSAYNNKFTAQKIDIQAKMLLDAMVILKSVGKFTIFK